MYLPERSCLIVSEVSLCIVASFRPCAVTKSTSDWDVFVS